MKKNNPSVLKLRLSEFAYGIGTNKRQFTKAIEVSESFLTSDGGITEEKILKIVSVFPQLNTHWLLTGVGEMLLPETEEKDNLSENKPNLSKLKKGEERLVSNYDIKLLLTKQQKEMSELSDIVKSLSGIIEKQLKSNDDTIKTSFEFMTKQLDTLSSAIKDVKVETGEIKGKMFKIGNVG